MGTELGPDFALAKRLSDLEKLVRGLATRNVIPNSFVTITDSTADPDVSWIDAGTGGYVDGASMTVDVLAPGIATIEYYVPFIRLYAAAGTSAPLAAATYTGLINVDGFDVPNATAALQIGASILATERVTLQSPYLLRATVPLDIGSHTIKHRYQFTAQFDTGGHAGGERDDAVLSLSFQGN